VATFSAAARTLVQAVADRVFPCGVVEVGRAAGTIWRQAAGRRQFDASAPEATDDTVFDLASLTKVLATGALAMRLVDAGRLDLGLRVAEALPGWQRPDREQVRLVHLLTHSSGLPACRPYDRALQGRPAYEAAIAAEPLEYPPGTRSVYSDLGFIALGFLLEDVAGEPLDAQFDRLRQAIASGDDASRSSGAPELELWFGAPPDVWTRLAPTRVEPESLGQVHDANAAALGGVAGHAGLFGTAAAVGAFARSMLRSLAGGPPSGVLVSRSTAELFTRRCDIPGSSRALAWDTMLATSSCGTRMSRRAFGHTGFTGTSLWIDPEADVYVVALTNRVCPGGGSADDIARFRRALHDAVFADLA
jgi:CubicO group peptidase (beta-lactamase class C family)